MPATGHFGAALRSTLRATAAAYGYTLTISTSLGLLTSVHGSPHSGRLFLFVAGGVTGFAVLEVATMLLPTDDSQPQSAFPFAGVLNLLSVCAGLGAAVGLAHAVHDAVGWYVTPLGATVAYLAVVALQITVVSLASRARNG